jgi:rRNA maturation RNase YbeY
MISIQVAADPDLEQPSPEPVEKILSDVFQSEGLKTAEVTVIFGDDVLLNRLKRTYFHVDQLTDVIAFRLNEESETSLEGEIYISLPRARENAETFQEPYPREVARLIIHGGLHLLGYEDDSDEDQQRMRTRENYYLGKTPWEELFK